MTFFTAAAWSRLSNGAAILALATVLMPAPAAAVTQSWNGYRWARTGLLDIRVGDNLSSDWDRIVNTAIAGWRPARNIDFTAAVGLSSPLGCAPVFGGVQACSGNYGATGWLGYTNVWTSGGFVVQATVRFNDYYFDMARYDTPEWRASVACHELGHTLGLAHNDGIRNNVNKGTCLDYTNDPSGKKGTNGTRANTRPGSTDFAALNSIYAKPDSTQLSLTKAGYRIGDGYFIDGDFAPRIVAVPEPGSWALLIAGFGLLGAAQRRRRVSPSTAALRCR